MHASVIRVVVGWGDSLSPIRYAAVALTKNTERIMYVLKCRTVSALTRALYENNPRVSAETVRHECTYIISFLTRHKESINDDKITILTHCSRVSLGRFSFCWWRHNRLLMTSQWPDNCDAITWIVIFNSIVIDFIHGDIHDRSCKNHW